MTGLTATTSMRDWIDSGWTITSLHVLEIAGPQPSPPMANSELLKEWDPAADALRGEFELMGPDAHWELIQDLAVAEQALEEYDVAGIEGTLPYSEYRARRLGPES